MAQVRPRRIRAPRIRSSRIRRRRFALRFSNPTVQDCLRWNNVLLLGSDAEHCGDLTFFVMQTERGDGTSGDSTEGLVHYQAYCEFRKAVEWSSVKKIFGHGLHVENARANAAANIRYCTKNRTRLLGEDICIRGQWGLPKRSGNQMMCAIKILGGAKLEQIVDEHPAMALLHMAHLESLIAFAKGARHERPKVTILFGKTGCGKSQYCMNEFGVSAYWVTPPESGRVWFGHYTGQDVCIFDDFHAGWFTLTHLQRIIDSTPLLVSPKCAQVPFNSGYLVFITNVDPRDWYSGYKGKKEHKVALERRIREFAEIWDCSLETFATGMGHSRMRQRRVRRTDTFTFRDDFGYDFNRNSNSF